MPEPIIEQKEAEGFQDVAAHNEEVKRKLEAQGREMQPDPSDHQAASDALDAIAAQVTKKEEPVAEEGEEPPPADPVDPVEPAVEDPAAKEAAEKAQKEEQEKAAAKARAEELFKGSPTLPPGASPKSSEAFSSIKIKAAQEIETRDAQIAEFKARLEEAEAKLKEGPDPEVLKELEEHRQWRAKLDVEVDPKFKAFDKQVSASQDFIYAQLKKSPAVTDETIKNIKALGGPENVNLDKLFKSINDPTLQRIVETKVAEIETAKWNKEEAVKAAKQNIQQYQEERAKAFQENSTAHNRATQEQFVKLQAKLPWFVEKPVDPKADEPTKKELAAHNDFVRATKAQLDEALKDDSAEMRAIMLTGMAQLLYLQRVRAAEKAQFEALQKELTEAKEKLGKVTKASSSRIRETAAPSSGALPTKPKTPQFGMHTSDALDEIAKQITEERAKKVNA